MLSEALERVLSPRGSVAFPIAIVVGFVGLVCAWLTVVPFSGTHSFDALYFSLVFSLTSLSVTAIYFHLQLRSLKLAGYSRFELFGALVLFFVAYGLIHVALASFAPNSSRQLSNFAVALLFPALFCSLFVWQLRRRVGRLSRAHIAEVRLIVAYYATCICSYVLMGASVAMFNRTRDMPVQHAGAIALFHILRVCMTTLAAAISRGMRSGLVNWENYSVFFLSAMYQFQLRWLVINSPGWSLVPVVGVTLLSEFLHYPFRLTSLYTRALQPRLESCMSFCRTRLLPCACCLGVLAPAYTPLPTTVHDGTSPLIMDDAASPPNPSAVVVATRPTSAATTTTTTTSASSSSSTTTTDKDPGTAPAPAPTLTPVDAQLRLFRAYHAYDTTKITCLISFTLVFALLQQSPNRVFFPIIDKLAMRVTTENVVWVNGTLLVIDLASRKVYSFAVFRRALLVRTFTEHHALLKHSGAAAMYAIAIWHLLSVSLDAMFERQPT